ncbi:MAG: hypothetical protein Q8K30_02870 [Candidatus Gracilibacteria bacterium]|nr:hypothetical protein [Candidatus Gracilibacteria bacterium]
MQIFLSYKQTGLDKKNLKKELSSIKKIIENTNNEVYIYLFEELIDENPIKLVKLFKQKIKKSNLVIGLINNIEKSEGELLELGLAEALNKKILLLVNNNIKPYYSLIYGLNADIIYYDDISDLEILLINYLKGK